MIMKSNGLLRKLRFAQGFTLLEITIAVFLFVVALFAIASTTSMTISTNTFNKEITTATTIAQDKIEDMKNLAYANLSACPASSSCTGCTCTCSAGTTTCTDYVTFNFTVQNSSAGSFYTRSWTIGPDSNDPTNANIRAVTVTVTWTWKGTSHTDTLTTSIAK